MLSQVRFSGINFTITGRQLSDKFGCFLIRKESDNVIEKGVEIRHHIPRGGEIKTFNIRKLTDSY